MQSSIEDYLHLLVCEHFLRASTTVAVAFFCYNGQPLQIPACLYQATRIDVGSRPNFARMATYATKRKHHCKCEHFPTLNLAWLSLAWPQCKPALIANKGETSLKFFTRIFVSAEKILKPDEKQQTDT